MPTIGDTLAERYRLDAVIGRGGFASVYRAHDDRLGRDVAVKVLRSDLASDPVIAARFDREARALAAVSHPNVVAVHDVSSGDPDADIPPFLVMELCEDGSLADRLASTATGALPPDLLVPILVDVAAGLDALHARGIVHRDVKPSNVLLSDARARIADLGIAAVGPSELTATGATLGTLGYLAPEQLAGQNGSPAGDVHGLGAITFLGLTGRLPRPATSVTEVVAASRRPVEPVSAVRPDLGPAFDEPIAASLALDPLARPSAAEVGAMLGVALDAWSGRPTAGVAADAETLGALPAAASGVAAMESAPTEVVGTGEMRREGDVAGAPSVPLGPEEIPVVGLAGVVATAPAAVSAGLRGSDPAVADVAAAAAPGVTAPLAERSAAPAVNIPDPSAVTASALVAAASSVVPGTAPPGTRPAVPTPPAAVPVTASARRSASRRDTRVIAAAVLATGLVVIVAGLFVLGLGGSGRPAASAAAGAGASAGTPVASARASAAPASTRAAPPPADPYAQARAASDDMRAAIAGANLKDKDAKDLANGLDQVDKALDKQDAKAARNEAKKLDDRVTKLVGHGGVAGGAATRLRTAADRLAAATDALPA